MRVADFTAPATALKVPLYVANDGRLSADDGKRRPAAMPDAPAAAKSAAGPPTVIDLTVAEQPATPGTDQLAWGDPFGAATDKPILVPRAAPGPSLLADPPAPVRGPFSANYHGGAGSLLWNPLTWSL